MSVKRKVLSTHSVSSSRTKPEVPGDQATRSAELLWRSALGSRRGPRTSLTAERVARTGILLADEHGLAAVSMNRIAVDLGVTTMALYRHVPGKTELVDLMFDLAMGPPPDLAAIAGGWRPKLAGWARQMWVLTLEHPWALEVLTRLRLPGPNELAWMECGAEALQESGLAGGPALDALFLIAGQVRSAAQYAVIAPVGSASLTAAQWATGVSILLREHSDAFPALTGAISAGAFSPAADPLSFGLDRILDGLEVLIRAEAATRIARRKAGTRSSR